MESTTIKGFDYSLATARFSQKISSGFPPLDSLLGGGLQEGELSEWGMPWGQCLRDLILPFLSSAQKQYGYWILWVSGEDRITINPWAWHARSIDLETLRFVRSQDPLYDLRQLFHSDFFRVIVLDQIPHLKEEDCQHLARHARRYGLTIIILRPDHLTPEKGNIWARLRLNCFRDWQKEGIRVEVVKGRAQRALNFTASDVAFYREEAWRY